MAANSSALIPAWRDRLDANTASAHFRADIHARFALIKVPVTLERKPDQPNLGATDQMPKEIRALSYFIQYDPLLVGGLLLIGVSAILSFRIQLRMLRIEKSSYSFFGFPRRFDWKTYVKYLGVRKQQGWSAWPVYLMLFSLVLGIILFVVGLFRERAPNCFPRGKAFEWRSQIR